MLIARLIASTTRTGGCTRLTSGVLLLNSLLVVSPVSAMVVLDFVEGSGECVEKRANNSQDECTPGQVARIVASIRRLPGHSVRASTTRQTPRAIAMLGTGEAAIWTRQHRDCDEGADEQ
jgi:hypothetical protein